MTNKQTCSKCGAELLNEALGGVCVPCGLQQALRANKPTEAPDLLQRAIRLSLPPAEKTGDKIGNYKLHEQLGEGGCGVVYLAEQKEPIRRRVALKVIKLGMDTKQVVARFEAERQALAMMDHPNIAKVLDAGSTENGRPFFVMELVRGIKITDYCDKNQLSTEDRLKLFIQVCHAIQHAHQKGIIHRDIKPSNILVTLHDGVPVPKVIDFGIAKATTGQPLGDKTIFTAFEQFIGTPAYMSPEQAEMSGLDIDTRTDVYALGVLLYELLTGKTPFDAKALFAKGLDEVRRIIREEEPPRPSARLSTLDASEQTTLSKLRQSEPPKLLGAIRGDLDWIVMKTLEKDRTRRYETANGLAMEIERYLNSELVLARPPSRLYRFQKMVRRNRFAVVSTAAVIVALLVGMFGFMWQTQRAKAAEREAVAQRIQAEEDKKRAELEASRSQRMAKFLTETLNHVGPTLGLNRDEGILRGMAQDSFEESVERVGKDWKDQPEIEAALRNSIAQVFLAMGNYPKAETMHRDALAMFRQIRGEHSWDVMTSLDNLAIVLIKQNKNPEAETVRKDALIIRRKLLGNEEISVGNALHELGWQVWNAKGRMLEAENLHRESLAIYRKRLRGTDRRIAWSLRGMVFALRDQKKFDEAARFAREETDLILKMGANAVSFPDILESLGDLVDALKEQNKLGEAESACREALALSKKQNGGTYDTSVAACLQILGKTLVAEGKLGEAESALREALELRFKLQGNQHPDIRGPIAELIGVLDKQGKIDEAEKLCVEAKDLAQKWRSSNGSDAVSILNTIGIRLRYQNRLDESASIYRERLQIARSINRTNDVITSLGSLAHTLLYNGKYSEAEPVIQEVLMLNQLTSPKNWYYFHNESMLGESLLGQKKYSEAEPLLISGYEGLKLQEQGISPITRAIRIKEALERLVQLYELTGQTSKFAEWRAKLENYNRNNPNVAGPKLAPK